MISRRHFLSASAGMAALASGMPTARAEGGQVVVGTWGGDYGQLLSDIIDKPIMTPKGFEIVQDVANADPRKTKLLAERQSRRGSMDVSCLSDNDAYIVSQSDVFEKIDAAQVKRLDKVFPELRSEIAIPHIYSAQVILYNTNQVKTPPQSFADLWDPKWRGKIGLADILYPNNTLAAALAGGGGVSNLDPAEKKLMEWRSLDVKIYPSNEALAAALKSEEVWITTMWLARGFMWKKSGIPLAHVVPKEGTPAIVFQASVPKNAKNKAGGFAYLDAMLDAKAQGGFADKMGYVPTVTDAPLPEDLAKQVSLTEAERARLLKPDYAYAAGRSQRTLDFWNKEFKA
ncbi:Putative ABC transporter (substrate binding protein) [Bradyrhizobium sp. ORS 285]|uniref:ABC transporter substrate-binding protein n=1 Tax=Bradyrhizobium sp. ORS 285 TaxID=115808 RepID=UPI000240AB19|nr:extracellular solute-binding protein [Bradyrhizobium sp. ORS 285]CCD84125.1 putative ABC transporter (substrate binding protein) [Bradyrhizobium sp. ORS 285]SMX60640.1 Putative ABC transporter (substrate binding protein) [Bradyrhizobium sp. ORS 285]